MVWMLPVVVLFLFRELLVSCSAVAFVKHYLIWFSCLVTVAFVRGEELDRQVAARGGGRGHISCRKADFVPKVTRLGSQ